MDNDSAKECVGGGVADIETEELESGYQRSLTAACREWKRHESSTVAWFSQGWTAQSLNVFKISNG